MNVCRWACGRQFDHESEVAMPFLYLESTSRTNSSRSCTTKQRPSVWEESTEVDSQCELWGWRHPKEQSSNSGGDCTYAVPKKPHLMGGRKWQTLVCETTDAQKHSHFNKTKMGATYEQGQAFPSRTRRSEVEQERSCAARDPGPWNHLPCCWRRCPFSWLPLDRMEALCRDLWSGHGSHGGLCPERNAELRGSWWEDRSKDLFVSKQNCNWLATSCLCFDMVYGLVLALVKNHCQMSEMTPGTGSCSAADCRRDSSKTNKAD